MLRIAPWSALHLRPNDLLHWRAIEWGYRRRPDQIQPRRGSPVLAEIWRRDRADHASSPGPVGFSPISCADWLTDRDRASRMSIPEGWPRWLARGVTGGKAPEWPRPTSTIGRARGFSRHRRRSTCAPERKRETRLTPRKASSSTICEAPSNRKSSARYRGLIRVGVSIAPRTQPENALRMMPPTLDGVDRVKQVEKVKRLVSAGHPWTFHVLSRLSNTWQPKWMSLPESPHPEYCLLPKLYLLDCGHRFFGLCRIGEP